MSEKTLDDIFQLLHKGLAEKFLAEIKKDEVLPATLNALRQFLRDNGITQGAGSGENEDLLSELEKALDGVDFEDQDNVHQLRQ